MNERATKAPRHLWVVGVLAVLWNAIGAFDFSATQLRYEPYMSGYTPEQLDYFYGFPIWAAAAWGVAVWSALLGSVCLLLRKAWAVWLFEISIAAMVITAIYNFVLSDGLALMGPGAVTFTAVIWAIAFFLFFYARKMAARKVLT
jgi:hypothetical protein